MRLVSQLEFCAGAAARWSWRTPDSADVPGRDQAPDESGRVNRERSCSASPDLLDIAAMLAGWRHPTCPRVRRSCSARGPGLAGSAAHVRCQLPADLEGATFATSCCRAARSLRLLTQPEHGFSCGRSSKQKRAI